MDCLWPAATADGTLGEKEVHVWCANLESAADQLAAMQDTLTIAEDTRAGRFRFWRHQRRFIACRGILRLLLGRYLDIFPKDIVISYSEYGKPHLTNNKIQFNVSHSKETALYAFCLAGDIGIDLEKIRPINDAEGIAARFFSTAEYARFQDLPVEQRNEAFFSCWTRKEAFIKAVGEGLSYPLSDFDVSFSSEEKARLNTIRGSAEEAGCWSLIPLAPMVGYKAALVVKGRGWQLSQRQFKAVD